MYRSSAYDLLLELLAQWICRNPKYTLAGILNANPGMRCMPFLGLDVYLKNEKNKKLYDKIEKLDLFKHYYIAAKARPQDYLGRLFEEQELGAMKSGIFMTPVNVVKFMVAVTISGDVETRHAAKRFCWESHNNYRRNYLRIHHVPAFHIRPMEIPFQTIMDPCVGSGRFLLETSIMYPKANFAFFGIDINVTMYRTSLVNMVHMSNHCFTLLCGNSLRLGTTSSSNEIWALGNRWEIPDLTEFYWKPKPKVPLLTALTNRTKRPVMGPSVKSAKFSFEDLVTS